MAKEQKKVSFQRIAGALQAIEESVEELARSVDDERPVAAVRENVGYLKELALSLFTEKNIRSEDFRALDEVERKPRLEDTLPSTPTFLIGCRRSGTTLVSWLLDSHPRFAAVPENSLCATLLGTGAHRTGASHFSRWTPIAPLGKAAARVHRGLGEPRPRFWQRVAELVHGVFHDYALRAGKERWLAKEIFLWDALDFLDMVFDYRARYLYVVRHGVDAALSTAQRFGARDGAPTLGGSGLDVANYLREWVENNEATLDFHERNPERSCRVRYEDLVANPENVTRGIFEFLEEPWHETLFEDVQAQDHHPGLGDNRIFETGGRIDPSRRERWKSLPPALLRQLGRLADDTLVRLGYEPLAS